MKKSIDKTCFYSAYLQTWCLLQSNLSFAAIELDQSTAADNRTVIDLTGQQLKKIPKNNSTSQVRQLILDENDLSKFDNIETYLQIEKVK